MYTKKLIEHNENMAKVFKTLFSSASAQDYLCSISTAIKKSTNSLDRDVEENLYQLPSG